MPIINKGTSFSNGEQLTADKLNNLVDQAEFNSAATDGATTFVNSSGQIAVAESGISAGKLATNAVETAKILDANVTLPKIATQADQTVIANVSGGVASPTAVDIVGASGILIDDDALGTSDTAGATQGNIKAYVDSLTTIKAHCVWDPALTGTNAPISGSGVTSVTRNSAGKWTINLSVTAPLSNFVTLVSSDTSSTGSINTAIGAYSTSTTTVSVTREGSNGVGYDGSSPISFTAIW